MIPDVNSTIIIVTSYRQASFTHCHISKKRTFGMLDLYVQKNNKICFKLQTGILHTLPYIKEESICYLRPNVNTCSTCTRSLLHI